MTDSQPRIALIHATAIAVEPVAAALHNAWPEARPVNILDDSLSPDLDAAGELSSALSDRIVALAQYAYDIGSKGILFTCSSFGPAIERAAGVLGIPVLKPNEAMFGAAVRQGGRVAMLYTFPPARVSMEREFREEARRLGSPAELTPILVDGAIEAIRRGDVETHNRLVAEAATRLYGFDSITLAHFSTSRALESVRAVTSVPVFTSPDAAVAKLRTLLGSH